MKIQVTKPVSLQFFAFTFARLRKKSNAITLGYFMHVEGNTVTQSQAIIQTRQEKDLA